MENPRHWRLNAQRYRLEGSRCPSCGILSFPPRPAVGAANSAGTCPRCGAQAGHIGGPTFLDPVSSICALRLDVPVPARVMEEITG